MYDDPIEEIDALKAELAMTRASRDEARADTGRLNAAHAALDDVGAPAADGDLAGRVRALASDLKAARGDLKAAEAERDALKARLAALPDVADPRDPPVESAAEAVIKRLWGVIADHMPDIDPTNCEHTIETALGSMVWHYHTQITIRDERVKRARAMLHAAIDREIDSD